MSHSITDRQFWFGLGVLVLALAGTVIAPYDRLTWLMEVAPVLIAMPLLIATRKGFPLSRVLYVVIFIHCLILILGGLYTYARVPLGFWIQEAFDLSRNPYDKIGHFAQGVTPALLVREIFLRRSVIRAGGWLTFVAISVSLAFSAFYELVEWWAALALGQGADEFLGTQGYVWDTQSDMFYALMGAVCVVLIMDVFGKRIRF